MARATGVTGVNPNIYDPRKDEKGKYLKAVEKDLTKQRQQLGIGTRKGVGNPTPLKHPEGQ